jgi:hypothetical protein
VLFVLFAAALLALSKDAYARCNAVEVLAMAGNAVRAQVLVDDLAKRFPEDTWMRFSCLPQCHLSGGKHTCIEKDIAIVALEKIVTVLPQDTFGISKILSDYRVETTLQKLDDSSTRWK